MHTISPDIAHTGVCYQKIMLSSRPIAHTLNPDGVRRTTEPSEGLPDG